MTKFLAYYEDFAKVKAACKGDEDSYVDAAHQSNNHTRKMFTTLDAAVEWLKPAIDSRLTVFGMGSVLEIDAVKKRCRYCLCNGEQVTRRHNVDDTGIAESINEDSEC